METSPSRRRRTGRWASATAVSVALVGTAGAIAPQAAHAVVPAPSAHYDMSHSGTSLLDVSGNGRHATMTGLSDDSFLDAGGDDVLRFNRDGYASMPSGAVTGTDNAFTVEYTVTTQTAANQFGWVIGDGIGNWNTTQLGNHVFVNPMSPEGSYNRQVLSGIRVKTGTGNGEVRMPAGGGLNPGFSTLTLVGEGNTLRLYRDGVQISTHTHTYAMSSIVPTGSVLGYLGRSLYAPDPLLKADVTDVKVWDVALTADQVTESMPTAAQKAAATDAVIRADLEPIMLGSNPSLDEVSSDLVLPATINGVSLSWASSDTAAVATDGTVTRGTVDQQVTLTATTGLGTTLTYQVTVIASSPSADLDAISLVSPTTENLPLATTGRDSGSTITWTSSDPDLVTPTDTAYEAPAVGAADPFAGGGLVSRPAYGEGDRQVTLTASATLGGNTVTRDFAITVKEQGRSAPDAGYAAAYFTSDSDERIYQAATSGNDFFTFSPVNGGNPTVVSTTDTTGLRDPYILRSANGDKYYMIATDLCIGCGTGWGPAQSAGSLKVEVWESTDLVTWTRTNGTNSGIVINQPEAGMTWAPEAYWDDDLKSYVVFFSSRLYADETHTNTDNLYARVFYVLTRDFKTFTYPPASWQDTGYARIDSTITKIGDYYYRFTKNEESGAAGILEAGKDIFLEKSSVLTAPTTVSNWSANPDTTWQLTDTRMTGLETGQAGEGPQIVKLNEGDPNNPSGDGYAFLVDNYGSGGYRAFLTTGADIASSSQANRLSQRAEWVVEPQGGLPPSPRHGSFVNVSQQVLDALHGWTSVVAVDSTTTLTVDGERLATAVVEAEDEGEVVGTVTFSGGDWSATVELADGTASVTVPDGITSVTAHYDGYDDGLVAPSTSATVQLAGVELVASASARCVAGKVQVVLTVRNAGDEAAAVSVTTPYGSRSWAAVAPGKSVSAAFATRQVAISGQTAEVTGQTDGLPDYQEQVALPAQSCG